MENVEQYLREETGNDWQEISQLYLSFRVVTNPFGQICVFTPDDIGRTLRPRWYIPKDCYHLHNPGVFLHEYLNAKRNLVQAMPIIQLNLDSGPKLKFVTPVPPLLFTGELSLKGYLNFKKTGNINNSIISKNGLM